MKAKTKTITITAVTSVIMTLITILVVIALIPDSYLLYRTI